MFCLINFIFTDCHVNFRMGRSIRATRMINEALDSLKEYYEELKRNSTFQF